MRWIARRKATWVIATWFAAIGLVAAQGPSSRRLRIEMPERIGPPIVVSPPDVKKAPVAVNAEVGNARSARPVPGSVSIVMPTGSLEGWFWFPTVRCPIPVPIAGPTP